jgi:hypothetical protein
MKNDSQILCHVFLNSFRRRKELFVNLAGSSHIPCPNNVPSFVFIIVSSVNNNEVFINLTFASHV